MGRHRAGDGVRAPWQEGTREALAAVGLDPGGVREFAIRIIAEDLGPGWVDITAAVTVPIEDERRAEIVALEDGVVAGLLLRRYCSRRPRPASTCPSRPQTCGCSTEPGSGPGTCSRTSAAAPGCCSRRSGRCSGP